MFHRNWSVHNFNELCRSCSESKATVLRPLSWEHVSLSYFCINVSRKQSAVPKCFHRAILFWHNDQYARASHGKSTVKHFLKTYEKAAQVGRLVPALYLSPGLQAEECFMPSRAETGRGWWEDILKVGGWGETFLGRGEGRVAGRFGPGGGRVSRGLLCYISPGSAGITLCFMYIYQFHKLQSSFVAVLVHFPSVVLHILFFVVY